MNRRGFISLLTGAAGAALVPWRGNVEPLISLPPRSSLLYGLGAPTWDFSNRLTPSSVLSARMVEEMLTDIRKSIYHPVALVPPRLIVSPQIKHLIDTDPIVRQAAEIALGRKL